MLSDVLPRQISMESYTVVHPNLNRVLQRALLPAFIPHRYRSLSPVLYSIELSLIPLTLDVLRAARMTLSSFLTSLPPSNSALGEAARTSKRPSQASAKTTPERPRLRRPPSPDTPASPTDSLPSLSKIARGGRTSPSPVPVPVPKAPEAFEAPPALGRGKRKKMPTTRLAEARDQQLL